jgi:1-acyl-sn-glycerol-3-phosphate acyltransferase
MEVLIGRKKRINQGLSICIFQKVVPDDESILLDTFKDGAFRLAIEHQIRLFPSRLPIIKAIFLYFFSEAPVLCVSKCMIMLILW